MYLCCLLCRRRPYFPRSSRPFWYGRGRLKHGLAGRTDNRAFVQVIKFRVAIATDALGAEFGFCHVSYLLLGVITGLRAIPFPNRAKKPPIRCGGSSAALSVRGLSIYMMYHGVLKEVTKGSALTSRFLRFSGSLFVLPMSARISHHLNANYQLNVTRRPALSHCGNALASFRARNF